jgi:outer membrane protein OmpA-like peptidoglycan-associated protein
MNRSWHRPSIGGLPILSAALLSIGGLMWDGASSSAAAQTHSGASNEVIVDYGALNTLSGQAAPQGARAGAQPAPLAPGQAAGLAAPPAGTPSSVLTTMGPDGRPIAPIMLKKPGSTTQNAQQPKAAEPAVAAVTPPAEPSEVPAEVPMPEPTPEPPAPGVNAETPPAAPAVETPAPPAEAAAPAEETPPPEQPAEEQTAEQPPAPEAPAPEAAAGAAPPAEGEAADAEEQPTEQAAAEPAPAPDNSQPAAPIPEGGIRIVFPTEFNEVPAEANAALDDLAGQMLADENMRIQIMCYASGTVDTESKARRRSLARCINVRQYLFKKDVRTTRMDVRALGLKSEGQPADRVDIVPANS